MVAQPSKRTARAEQAPSGFYVTRVSQFVCAFIVSGIQAHFIYRLVRGHFGLPYLFFVIMGAAVVTILNFILSNVLYACHHLNVTFSAVVQGILTVLWSVCFGLLAKATRATIGLQCTKDIWANDQGIQVCREYKVLFTFVLMVTFASIASFAHDFATIRGNKGRGKYALAEDTKPLHDNSSSVSVGGAWDLPPAYGGASQTDFELQQRNTAPLASNSYEQPYGPSSYNTPYDPYSGSGRTQSTYSTEGNYHQGPGSYQDVSAQPQSTGTAYQSATYQTPAYDHPADTYQTQIPGNTYQDPNAYQSSYQRVVSGITGQGSGYQVPSEQLQHMDTTYRH